jgi:hypothetical protein
VIVGVAEGVGGGGRVVAVGVIKRVGVTEIVAMGEGEMAGKGMGVV